MQNLNEMAKDIIKLLVMDVDGTLTDGRVGYLSNGEEIKYFNIKDGYGIKEIANSNEIQCAIITGRYSNMVVQRCAELNISELYQGVSNKVDCLKEIAKRLNISLSNIAYIGDDMNDFAAMSHCGIKGCPNDAVEEIRAICDYISKKNGGHGAVRDFIEYLVLYNKEAM